MKRYSIDFYGDKMVEDKDGEYVKYDDAQKIREAYYGAWENAVVNGLLESDMRDELSQQKDAFDNMQKQYLEVIVAANDNAEKLDAMTALAEKYKVCGNCYHYRGDMCYYDLDRVLVDRKEKCDNWRFDEEV